MSSDVLLGPFPRSAGASLEESSLLFRLLKNIRPRPIMLDVGAHYGGSLIRFAKAGWRVVAFEPDPANREVLHRRLVEQGVSSRVLVDPRACAAEPVPSARLFASEESTGISGLNPFRDTHHEVAQVEVTTLKEACLQHELEHLDFLKIDTEGFDLPVLQGLDWRRTTPSVILCEFEDSKTEPLGYDFYDLGDFLMNKGYHVFASIWHPVIRYGVAHQWHLLSTYPCRLDDTASWGNFLAFRSPIDSTDLALAAKAVLTFRPAPPQQGPSTTEPSASIADAVAVSRVPRTSIIMPALNEARCIGEAIESLLTQTDPDWELLVIDDGSRDDTSIIVQRYASQDARIRLLTNSGKGVAAARNTGLAEARGGLITFLDADDAYGPDAIGVRAAFLDRNAASEAVFCDTQMADHVLHPLGWRLGYPRTVGFRDMYGCPFSMNAVMIRAEVVGDHRFKQGLANGEDWLFWSRLARAGVEFKYVAGCEVYYRQHRGSTVLKDFCKHEQAITYVLQILYSPDPECQTALPEFRDGLSDPPLERVLLQRRFTLLIYHLLRGDQNAASQVAATFDPRTWCSESPHAIAQRVKLSVMRFLSCSESEWEVRWRREGTGIVDFLKRQFPPDRFPNMGRPLFNALAVTSFKSRSSKRLREIARRLELRRALSNAMILVYRKAVLTGAVITVTALAYAMTSFPGAILAIHLAPYPLIVGIYLRQRAALRHAAHERRRISQRLFEMETRLKLMERPSPTRDVKAHEVGAPTAPPRPITYFTPGRRVL